MREVRIQFIRMKTPIVLVALSILQKGFWYTVAYTFDLLTNIFFWSYYKIVIFIIQSIMMTTIAQGRILCAYLISTIAIQRYERSK